MNLRPLSDHLLVKPLRDDQYTKAGLVLPDSHEKERAERGEVVAVGPGKRLDNGSVAKMDIKVGDVIMFKKYAPDEFKIEEVEYLVLSESDVIAIIEK